MHQLDLNLYLACLFLAASICESIFPGQWVIQKTRLFDHDDSCIRGGCLSNESAACFCTFNHLQGVSPHLYSLFVDQADDHCIFVHDHVTFGAAGKVQNHQHGASVHHAGDSTHSVRTVESSRIKEEEDAGTGGDTEMACVDENMDDQQVNGQDDPGRMSKVDRIGMIRDV